MTHLNKIATIASAAFATVLLLAPAGLSQSEQEKAKARAAARPKASLKHVKTTLRSSTSITARARSWPRLRIVTSIISRPSRQTTPALP